MMLLADDLVERVGQIIPRYSMLKPDARVGVAVSGGADSVVLLHILHRLVSDLALHLTVLHVNHGLRGAESDEDEHFVRELARSLGLEVVGARAIPGPGNVEQEARRLRRELFLKWGDEHGLERIALGHTRSDQAETVLYRFLRGSGIAGLAGMRPVSEDRFVRPLLTTSRAEVRAWATRQELNWREDSSNESQKFARNRLRNNVLPALACEFNVNLETILAGMADVAAAEEDYWKPVIDSAYRALVRKSELGLLLRVPELIIREPAVQRRIIRKAICAVKGDLRSIDLGHVDAVVAVCQSVHGHDRVVIPGVDALRSFGTLLLTRPGELNSGPRNYQIEISCNETLNLPCGAGDIELSLLNSDDQNCVNFNKDSQSLREIVELDFTALFGESKDIRLEIRNWRPGDEILRPGHQNPEKIKSLFQQYQVALWQRRHWPVAVVLDKIVWARGFGAASSYMGKPESRQAVRLSFWPKADVTEL